MRARARVRLYCRLRRMRRTPAAPRGSRAIKFRAPAQYRHGDARGLEVSPSSLLQNELIQRQTGNRLVLKLKVLQALHLLGLQPTELLAPPITSLTPIWRIASTMVWPCETRTSTCRNFATISSGLYRFLATRSSLMSKTYLKSDHFNGGGCRIRRRMASGAIYALSHAISEVKIFASCLRTLA
jgi:hypothetical protein